MAKSTITRKPSVAKSALIARMLLRKKGCTRSDVLEATDWKAVSMQQQARAAGLALNVTGEHGSFRYFGKKKKGAGGK